jgi:SWI/SNF-related matrix-associated actin-dependent regulator 1 of chromatin subfamily A
MKPLMPHQTEAIASLDTGGNHFIAHEPGLGKTRTALESATHLWSRGLPNLVICPAIARQNWATEISKWLGGSITCQIGKPGDPVSAHFFICSYDAISRMTKQTRDKFLKQQWNVLICDEAHRLKSRTSKRTKYVYGYRCEMKNAIAARAKHVWLLSGTPRPNYNDELWSHLRALNPQAIWLDDLDRPMNYHEFVDRYCSTTVNLFGVQVVGSRRTAHLKQRMTGFFHPKRLDDADLPELTLDTYDLDSTGLGKGSLAGIDALYGPALALGGDDDAVLDALGRMPHVATERRLLGMLKAPKVTELVEQELENYQKLVVFFHHHDVGKQIATNLAKYGVGYIDGGVTDKARNETIRRFQNGNAIRVFVGQLQACGEAITLTAARRVLFAEVSWVPSENFQAMKRCHRIGQTGSVYASMLTFAGTMDKRILSAVRRKTADLDVVMQ